MNPSQTPAPTGESLIREISDEENLYTIHFNLRYSLAEMQDLDRIHPSRELSLAITKTEEAIDWLNKVGDYNRSTSDGKTNKTPFRNEEG